MKVTSQKIFWLVRVTTLLVFLFVVMVNLGVQIFSAPYIYSEASAPRAQTVLIPGAAVLENGELSPIFLDRVDLAVRLYKGGHVSKILVSGDNSTLSYNEVNPVRLYLLSKGIPDTAIYLDHAGFDTYSSLYRARDIFQVESILIATQSFHLPRAIFTARMLGLEASGVDADLGYIFRRNYVREVLANEKAVLDLLLRRSPKFLGEPIPIHEEKVSG